MRAAIYGAGSLGTILGAYITRKGGEIELINHNKAHVEALKDDGAHVVGTVDFTVPVKALLPEEMSGKYDILFLLTKQQHNVETIFLQHFSVFLPFLFFFVDLTLFESKINGFLVILASSFPSCFSSS